MTIVIIRLLCAVSILFVIAITYVVLQALGEKGINIFNKNIIRWTLSFVVGIFLFLLGAKFILT